MIYKSEYLQNKEYSNKEDLFKALKENAEVIIDAKKSQILKSCDKGVSVSCRSLDLLKFTDQLKGIKIDDNFWYIAVNSTRILDSHEDLHLDGIWKKSVSESQGKNYLVADHDLKVGSVIVRKEHIEIFTAKVPFSLIGKSYDGDTEVLIYKVPKSQVKNQTVKEWLESGDSIEGSVRMQYVTILLALDSNNPDDETEKSNYDQYYPIIANKKDFDYIPYFFAIKEAKNVRESSLVVFGSNHATGIARKEENKTEAVDDTSTQEAEKSLQIEETHKELLKQLLKKF